nr:GNAT family N-acetyltransferase [Xylophilus sp. ASV27]
MSETPPRRDRPTPHHDATAHRYEARADGVAVGHVDYRLEGDGIVFTHTEVSPDHEGQGIGGFLARGALDAARASGRTVVPRCSFIAAYLRRHPDELALVRPEVRRELGL